MKKNVVADYLTVEEANKHFFKYSNLTSLSRKIREGGLPDEAYLEFGKVNAIKLEYLKNIFPLVNYQMEIKEDENPVSLEDYYPSSYVKEVYGLTDLFNRIHTRGQIPEDKTLQFNGVFGVEKEYVEKKYYTLNEQKKAKIQAMDLSEKAKEDFADGALFTGDVREAMATYNKTKDYEGLFYFFQGYFYDFRLELAKEK